MIYNLFFGFVIAAVLGVGMIIAHEIGHLKTLEKFGRSAKISFKNKSFIVGTKKDYEGLTKKQLKEIYINGILLGLVPVLIIMLALESYTPLIILPAYLLGCKHDIKQLRGLK